MTHRIFGHRTGRFGNLAMAPGPFAGGNAQPHPAKNGGKSKLTQKFKLIYIFWDTKKSTLALKNIVIIKHPI
jgi:hypothetical protein